jgi:single-strand DNA-binding protein
MASRSVNKVILVGHLGKDAETKYTTSGVAVSRFSIATNRRVKDAQTGDWKDETDWHNITLWRNEGLAPYLLKGKQVYVEGRLQTRSWDDKDGQKKYMTEVVTEDIILLSSGQGGQGGGQPSGAPRPDAADENQERRAPVSAPRGARPAPAAAPPADDFGPGISDDDVPF